MPEPETFPARLRRLRDEAALSQRKLAVRAGIRQQTLSRLEAGDTSPQLDTLRALAAALGTTAAALIEDTQG